MPEITNKLRIVALLGSMRPDNYTRRVLDVVIDELNKDERVSCELVDPSELNLPFPGQDTSGSDAKAMQALVGEADGVVIATPEYHGSFSSVTKLIIENLGFPSVLAGKPVTLVGAAAGAIGAIKSLESLRGVVSHVGSIVLPGAVSVARVRTVFDESGITDERVEKQLRGAARGLIHYLERHVCPRMALEAMVRERAA